MSVSPHTVLVEVVEIHRESGEPVTARALSESLDVPEANLSQPIDALSECELLEATGRGYRPTVTAHELLATNIEFDDVLALDPVEE